MSVYTNGIMVCGVVWAVVLFISVLNWSVERDQHSARLLVWAMRAVIAIPLWPVLVPAAAVYGWGRASAAFREDLHS